MVPLHVATKESYILATIMGLFCQCGHMKWFILGGRDPRCVALFELLVWPHEEEPWFHSWYRGRVEILDAKYNLIFR